LVVHSGGNWGDSEVLTLGRAAHLDLVSTEELDLLVGGSPGSVEDGSHRSCAELSVVSDEFFESILISLDGVKVIGTEKKGVAWRSDLVDHGHPWSVTVARGGVLGWVLAWSSEHLDAEIDDVRGFVDDTPSTIHVVFGGSSSSISLVRDSVDVSIGGQSSGSGAFGSTGRSGTGGKLESREWTSVSSSSGRGSSTLETFAFGAGNVVGSARSVGAGSKFERVSLHSGGAEVDTSPVVGGELTFGGNGGGSGTDSGGWDTGLVDGTFLVSDDTSWPDVEIKVLGVTTSGGGGSGNNVHDTSGVPVSVEIGIGWGHDAVHGLLLGGGRITVFDDGPNGDAEEEDDHGESSSKQIL